MPTPDPTSPTDEHGNPKSAAPDRPARGADAERDPTDTDHPAGAAHAASNAADEPPG